MEAQALGRRYPALIGREEPGDEASGSTGTAHRPAASGVSTAKTDSAAPGKDEMLRQMRQAAIDRVAALIGPLAVGAILALFAGAVALPAGAPALAPAPTPKPPLAYPGYVEQITASSAALKATINPRGSATEYYFQYGPTAAYGSQTAPASAGAGNQEVKLTQAVTGLTPYTTYHFRVVASSAAGTTDSADATFTTRKIPLSLTASATPNPAGYDSPLRISGQLSGTGSVGAEVVLQANPFPYLQGFRNITSPEQTNQAGGFLFPVAGLLESTHLRVAVAGQPAVYSPVIDELVSVGVSLHVRPAATRGFVRFYGTATPAQPGALVALEHFDRGRYVTVAGTKLRRREGGGARFGITVRLRRRGRYRALVQVTYGALASGRSRPVVVH
jgi:hypothetical protein